MKNHNLITMLMLLCVITAQAQTDDYQPLVREGVKWINHRQFIYYGDTPYFGPISTEVLQFSGEKDITTPSGTHTYKKIQGETEIYMRESDKKVYLLDRVEMYDEIVIYDFSRPDTAVYNSGYGYEESFVLCDMVEIEGKQCRIFSNYQNSSYLVESVGLVSKTYGDLIHTSMLPYAGGGSECHLDHVEDLDGNIIYKAPWYEAPANCKPLVREGVVWHYSRVYGDQPNEEACVMFFEGDSTVNDVTYKKCIEISSSGYRRVAALMREQDKVVYSIGGSGGVWGSHEGEYEGEIVLYDFHTPLNMYPSEYVEEGMELIPSTVMVDGIPHNCYTSSFDYFNIFVEGIGLDGSGTLSDLELVVLTSTHYQNTGLSYVEENGNIIYKGQAYEEPTQYQPLVREGVKWINHSQFVYSGDTFYFGPVDTYKYELKGDTVITTPSGTHTYKIVQGAYEVFIRESDKKVYVLDRQNWDYPNEEFLLYDFSQATQATLHSLGSTKSFKLIGTVDINGKPCRVYKDTETGYNDWGYLIESIGLVSKNDGDLIHPRWARVVGGEDNYGLDHLEDLDGNIIYKAPWYEAPAQYKPLVREGVVWHYAYEDFELDEEGMIDMSTYRLIDQKMEFLGDTTIYGITYKKCFMYETDQMASDEQSILLAREENGKVIFAPISFDWHDEEAYHPEGTLPGPYFDIRGEYITYDFGDMAGFLSKLQANGWGPTLESTSQTLVGADSVNCYRTNSGLYVESVGFDGDYSGYLDDPFPPKPDCVCPGVRGLIMATDREGNILYKGKYYSIAYELPKFDLNHDGVIDIADINFMINVMLGYDVPTGNQGHDTIPAEAAIPIADVTHDGQVDISDVNAIINAMLGK